MTIFTDPVSQPSKSAFWGAWALMLGVGLLMLGNGLQGTLLGVRATLEGYSSSVTGLIMSGFFIGFLIGSWWATKLVSKVGHIRVFAAFSSLASVSILIHALYVDPWIWAMMRFVTGICFAGIYVIAESWLNNIATNQTRGRLLSIYMITTFGGMVGGQLMLNLADPEQTSLFIAVSVLISLAAMPILLSANPAPEVVEANPVSFYRLYQVSPLGTIGTFAAGLINGTLFGMGAVYAHETGLSLAQISIFMGVLIAGGATLQWPIGRLSDMFDRRLIIMGVTFATCIMALVSDWMDGYDPVWFLISVGMFGGFALSIHALCLAYINDHLEPTELVGASSGLVSILGLGSIIGPPLVGLFMGVWGASAFFWWLMLVSALIGILALWRMTQRDSLPSEEQGPFVAITTQTSSVALATVEEFYADDSNAEVSE